MFEEDDDSRVISETINNESIPFRILSQKLWENPELGYNEVFAHSLLIDTLDNYGFTVEKHYLLPTAFRGEFSSTNDGDVRGPTIAILCEYDALPKIGHACGHNLISECGVAAALAVKTIMEEQPSIHGKLVVLGTPAEEGGGGKLKLLEQGAFDDIDAALMAHPGRYSLFDSDMVAITKIVVTYIGEEKNLLLQTSDDKNAMDAAVMCYSNVAKLKQSIKPKWRVNGIITKGGVSSHVIPRETQLEFWIRAPSSYELKLLKQRVLSCFDSAAVATGCEVVKEVLKLEHKNVITNEVMGNLFQKYAAHFGVNPEYKGNMPIIGSTDMGNVSHVIPSIHPFYGIGGDAVNHTKAFTTQASTEEAHVATLATAKALASVAVKLFKNPDILENAKRSFAEDIKNDLNLG